MITSVLGIIGSASISVQAGRGLRRTSIGNIKRDENIGILGTRA
jgi:hypothetical protein